MGLFTVLTRGRTGSTALVAEINQHPDVVCHQELFRSAPAISKNDLTPTYEAVRLSGRALTAEEYLREVEAAAPRHKVGFKLLQAHLEERKDIGLEHYVFSGSMPIIFLTRDATRAALSAAIAKERNIYSLAAAELDDEFRERMKRPVKLDASYVAMEAGYYAHWTEYWQNRLCDLDMPHIVVSYEQYGADRVGLLNSIFSFLEVSELRELEPNPYAKVTSENVWDDVLNADEVRAALSGAPTRRRWWRSFFSRR